jgi:hypothetical protein
MARICREIEQELATPTGRVSPVTMAAHLDACSACARIAARARTIDAAWLATRPDEPAESAWDATWAGVALALEAPEPAVLTMAGRRGAGRLAWIGLAAAAAAVLALTLNVPSKQVLKLPPAQVAVAQVDQLELPAGETSFLRFDDRGALTVQPVKEGEAGVGLGNDIFNFMESAAVPSLAVREAGPAENLFNVPRNLAD